MTVFINATFRSLTGEMLFFLMAIFYSNNLCLSQTGSIQYNIQKADSFLNAGQTNNAVDLYNKTINQLKTSDSTCQLAYVYLKIGQALLENNKDEHAKSYLKNCIELAKLNKDIPLTSDAYNNLGIVYEYTGKPDSAFFYYEKSLGHRLSLNDTSRISESYRNMAQILRLLRRLDEAKLYCRKAYVMIPGVKNYKTIANIYNETAYLFELTRKLDSAKLFYQKLIDISEKNDYKKGISVGLNNLASVLEREKNYNEALELKNKSLNIDRTINDFYGEMTSYISIADTYQKINRNKYSLLYLDSATMMCDSSWINNLHEIYLLKYSAYKNLGNFEMALKYHEKAIILSDSIFNETKRKNIAKILTRFETEQKEQDIILLKQENQLKKDRIKFQWFLIALILLSIISVAIIFVLILKSKNRKLKQMQIELQNFHLRQKNNDATNRNKEPNQIYQKMGLTQRESEILFFLGHGCTNSEIAKNLYISENTVKYHIKNIYIKLDVNNRVQALICCKNKTT